jgi:hypothetical protein
VFGPHCEPDIRGNLIANNRKSGIKITKNAIAHIGGTSKEDIKVQPMFLTNEMGPMDLNEEGTVLNNAPPKLTVESLSTLEAVQKESF